jgi:hypothetical protein
MDYDLEVLQAAFEIVMKLDVQYRQASFNDKVKLKKVRDEVFNTFSLARLKLLEDGMICTAADVQKMKDLKVKVQSAMALPTGVLSQLLPLFGPAGGFVGLLTKFL